MHALALSTLAVFAYPQARAVIAATFVLFLLCIIGQKTKSRALYVLCGIAFVVFLGLVFSSACTMGMMSCTFLQK